MSQRFTDFYDGFRPYMQTQTRDTSEYGLRYVSGLLRMDAKRNMANIGRKTNVGEQNMQHFMSHSPWSGSELITAIQDDIKQHSEFQHGAMLALDESAEEKAGEHSAGAGRQHNGRLGKVEMSQVGVFLSLVTPRANTWIDGELYLQKRWFTKAYAKRRKKAEIPETRTFHTKPELGWQMIRRAKANQVSFDAVVMDDLYGRNKVLRKRLEQAGIEYYGDVPANTVVYLDQPQIVYPLTKRGKEWLLIRQDAKQVTYVLSNAAPDTSLRTMAWRKSHRYFIERSNQDSKSELGWDEFQAIKYRAWEHHLALTILASWFVADTRLDWITRYERDPALLEHYEVDVLPMLSVGNVRDLFRAAMPLPQLTPHEATELVIKHLVNRTRSRKSRLLRQRVPEI